MSTKVGTFLLLGSTTILAIGLVGCGGGAPSADRPEVASVSEEDGLGGNIKQVVYEFRAKVKKRGPTAIKNDLPIVLESFQGLENRKLGSHEATYKEIETKLKAMQSISDKNAAVKAAEEVGTLADKLPGKANPNPVVD